VGRVLRFRTASTTFMPNPSPYAIILDDHPLVGRGMAQYLQSVRPELSVRAVTTWIEALTLVQAHGLPRVLVADLWLADGNSLPLLAQWHTGNPEVPWMAISADDDPATAQRVRAAGAKGFVHKQATPETFGQAIVAVLDGGTWFEAGRTPSAKDPAKREWQVTPAELGLTARQGDILALLLRGLSNKRIALMLDITESTVKEHVTAVLERLGVRTRVEAIMAMRGRRVVPPGNA
jgi:DNA-binding NarL/FixJ family response regulator